MTALTPDDAVQQWRELVESAQPNSIAPDEYRRIWDDCFSLWHVDHTGPAPLWFPTPGDLDHSNVARWTQSLNKTEELTCYSDFHQWTVQNRAEFWTQAIERVGIQFQSPPVSILDDTHGNANASWLQGAQLNIAESCFQADGSSIAIIAQKPGGPLRSLTYAELRGQSCQVANSLNEAGFQMGDAIGVVLPMTDWSVAIYLGVVMAGCTVVSIADSFAPPEIATRLQLANAKAVFTYDHQNRAGKKLPLFQRVAEATELPAIVLRTDTELSVELRSQDMDWTQFLVESTKFEPVACDAQHPVNILFSSGTTGDPKAIPWSHTTPIKCAVDGHCHQNIQPGDVCAWPTNLGWMMGPWLIFASLINRATIALYEDAPMGKGFGEFVQNANVTMLGVVPTIVKSWQATGEMEPFDWSSIKVFSSTGESSQLDSMFYLSSLAGMRPIIEYCGGTEIGGGYVSSVVVLPNVAAAFNTLAVGMDIVLLEPTDDQSPDSHRAVASQGEVFLIPPSIGLSSHLINRDHFETYYANTPSIPGVGTLRRHGDHFRRIDTDFGPLFVAGGRVDDTMNLGGIKISSAEIERVLNQLDSVQETAAIGDAETGGPTQLVIFAVVTGKPDVSGLQQSMNKLLKTELNPLFKVGSLRLIPTMPRTVSGKLLRRKLRDSIRRPDQ